MVNKYKTTLKWTPVGRRVAFSRRAAKVTRGWSWRMKSDKRFILEFRPAAWSPSLSFCARSTPLQVPFFTRLNADSHVTQYFHAWSYPGELKTGPKSC